MADNEHVVKITADTSQAEQNLDATSKKLDEVDQKAKKVDSSLSEMGSSLGTQADITGQMSNDLDNMEKSLDNINSNNGQSAFAEMSNSLSSMSDMLDDFANEIDVICESMGSNMSNSVQLIYNALQGVKEEASDVSQECQNMCDAASNMDVDALKDGFSNLKESTNSLSQDMNNFASIVDSISMRQVVDEGEQLETVVEDVVKATENINTAASKVASDIEETKTPFEEMSEEAEEVVSDIENISEKTSNINFDSTKSSVNELESEFDVLSQRAERLNETINMMNNFQAPTGQYKQMETDIESAENKLMKYMQEQQQMSENGTDINSPEWQQLQQNIDMAKQHVQELNSQMEELRTSGTGFNTTPTPEYSELEKQLQDLRDVKDELNSLPAGYAAVESELEKVSQEMAEINEQQRQMTNEGTAFQPVNDTAQFERYNESLAQTNMQMQNLQMQTQNTASSTQQLSSAGSNVGGTWQSAASSIGSSASQVNSTIGSVISSLGRITGVASGVAVAVGVVFSVIDTSMERYGEELQQEMELYQYMMQSATDGIKSALSSVASKITSVFTQVAKKAFKKFAEFIKNATLELIGLGEHTNIVKKVLEELKNLWDQFVNTMKSQIMRGISKLILEDLEEDLVVMAQFSDEFNEVMSDVIDAGKQLGLQLVAAIEPILNYVIPVLTQVFEWIDWMMVQITKLTSALTGRDYYYEAIKGNSDYASSMDDSTASTDDYTKATNQATQATMNFQSSVMGFDKLNRLSGSSKGNGGSTGVIGDIQDAVEAVGIDKPTLAKMQEEADEISSIGDQIWDAINNRDWYKAGYLMGAAVEEAFGWLDDVLGWSKNAEKFTKLVNAIIDACNGFIDYFLEDDGLHALTVGKYIGDMLNTLIECFKMLLDPETGINFEGLGEAIGYALIGAIKEINWYDLGQLIIEYFQMIPRILVGLFSTDIGTSLGEGVAEGIQGFADGFDTTTWENFFDGLFNTIFDFLIALFSDTSAFFEIGEKFGELMTSVISGLSAETEGGDSKLGKAIEGIFSAISSLISGFLTGFHVDAKDVETLVFTVLNGLLNGFTEILTADNEEGQTLTEKLGEFIKGCILGVADTFKEGDWQTLVTTIMDALFEALGEVFSDPEVFTTIGNGIAETINGLFGSIEDDLAKGTQTFNDKVDDNLEIQQPLYLGIDSSIEDSSTGIEKAISDVGADVEDTGGSVILNMIDSFVNLIISLIEGIDWEQMSDAICGILDKVFDALDASDFWDSLEGIIQMFTDIFVEAANRIPLGDILSILKDGINQIVTGIAKQQETEYLEGTDEAIEEALEEGNHLKAFTNRLSKNPIGKVFAQWGADIYGAKELSDADYNSGRFFKNLKMLRNDDSTYKMGNAISDMSTIATESFEEMDNAATRTQQNLSDMANSIVNSSEDVSGASEKTSSGFAGLSTKAMNAGKSVADSYSDMNTSAYETTDTMVGTSSAIGKAAENLTEKTGNSANLFKGMLHISADEYSNYASGTSDTAGSMATDINGSMSDVTNSVDSNTGEWGSILGSAATPFYTLSDDVDGAMGDMTTSVDEETEEQKGIFSRMFSKLSDWCDNSSVHIGTTFGKMNKDSKDSVDDTQAYTDTVFGEISESTALTSSDIEGFVQDTDISQMNLIEIVQAMLQNILDVFKTIMQQIGVSTEEFVVEFVDVFSSMEDAVENLCLQLDTYLTRMEKRISDFYANTSSTNTNNLSVKQPIYTLSIPALAGGGVVGDGQLFLANEQGVEAITSGANGSATVTNNDQMVRAITKGVQQAVENAMGGESRDNGDIVILVDGEELARASARGSRSMNKRTNPTVSYSYY